MQMTSCRYNVVSRQDLERIYANVKVEGVDNDLLRRIVFPNYMNMTKCHVYQMDDILLITGYYTGSTRKSISLLYQLYDGHLILLDNQEYPKQLSGYVRIELLPNKHVLYQKEFGEFEIYQIRHKTLFRIYQSLDICYVADLMINDALLVAIRQNSINEDEYTDNYYIVQLQQDKLPRVLYDERNDGRISPYIRTDYMSKITVIDDTVFLAHMRNRSYDIVGLHMTDDGIDIVPVIPDPKHPGALQSFGNMIDGIYPGYVFPKYDTIEEIACHVTCDTQDVIYYSNKKSALTEQLILETAFGEYLSVNYDKETKRFIATLESSVRD